METEKDNKNDLIQFLKEGLREAHQKVSYWKNEYERYWKIAGIYQGIAILSVSVLFLISVAHFKDFEITVEPNENRVVAVKTKWWGIIEKRREIRWMETNDYDSPGWMTKDENGDWYLYIEEPPPFIE